MRMLSHLFEGVASAGERIAQLDLERKARDAIAAHLHARRSLAQAVAMARQETARCGALAARAADLEERAVIALRAGREDLATSASEAIAALECELEAAARAVAEHDAVVARLSRAVEDQRRRIADIDRGRRLVAVRAALGASQGALSPVGHRVAEAEQALGAILQRQDAGDLLAEAADHEGSNLVEVMADTGFGAPLRPVARDVFARIRARAVEASPAAVSIDADVPR